MLRLAEERGEPWSVVVLRRHLCELELRAGEWGTASRLLDEWDESPDGELMGSGSYQRLRAQVAVGLGVPDEAKRWAAAAVASAEAADEPLHLLAAVRVRASAELAAREPAHAVESLGPIWEHMKREGIDEPGQFVLPPDLVEALLEVGDHAGALAVTDRLRELAERHEHPVGARDCHAVRRPHPARGADVRRGGSRRARAGRRTRTGSSGCVSTVRGRCSLWAGRSAG